MEKLDHDQFVLEDDSAQSQTPTYQIIDEYAKDSTIHGLKYVCDRKRNRFERIFWLIALIISFVFFLILFSKIWMRYSDGAITIEMKPEQKPIWDIPFPAITICAETKAKSSEIKFNEVYRKLAPGKRPFSNVTPDEYGGFPDYHDPEAIIYYYYNKQIQVNKTENVLPNWYNSLQ